MHENLLFIFLFWLLCQPINATPTTKQIQFIHNLPSRCGPFRLDYLFTNIILNFCVNLSFCFFFYLILYLLILFCRRQSLIHITYMLNGYRIINTKVKNSIDNTQITYETNNIKIKTMGVNMFSLVFHYTY